MLDPFASFQDVSPLAPAMFSGAVRNTTMIRLPCHIPPLFSFFLSFLSFRYSSFSSAGGRKTAQRILLACVVSLCSLLGAVSFDLSSSLEAWRSAGKALQELASCETLWAIRLISLLQEEKHSWLFPAADKRNTSFHAQLLENLNSLCKAREAELSCENCQCKKEKTSTCRLYIVDMRQRMNSTGGSEASEMLSGVISELLGLFSSPHEDLKAMRRNPDWADIVAFKLILLIGEAVLKAQLMPVSVSLQTTLHQLAATLNYAVFSSESAQKCWRDNVNQSLHFTSSEGIHFFIPFLGSDEFASIEALLKGLLNMQSCLLQRGQEKLIKKSKEILFTTSLKISLLVIACLIYPITLIFFKQMTDWIHNYARSLKEKTQDLKRERQLAEDLLHQMLPKSVAKQLRKCQKVEAENYDQVNLVCASKWKKLLTPGVGKHSEREHPPSSALRNLF